MFMETPKLGAASILRLDFITQPAPNTRGVPQANVDLLKNMFLNFSKSTIFTQSIYVKMRYILIFLT